jgi:thiamine-phosphate pyrophosphorylase
MLLDERADESDRGQHGEDDCKTRPHVVTLAWQCERAMRLYLVLAAEDTHVLEPALRGGVDVVQLRDKTLTDRELVAAARPFRKACTRHRALFILNDRPDLVERCFADGVHVGRSDASVAEARALIGPNRLVGLSASTIEELADVEGADYVGVTAFATPTKEDAVPGGLELVRDAAAALTIPWVAIGGIDRGNAAEVVAAGAPGIAVVRAIRDAEDPEAAARELRAVLDR